MPYGSTEKEIRRRKLFGNTAVLGITKDPVGWACLRRLTMFLDIIFMLFTSPHCTPRTRSNNISRNVRQTLGLNTSDNNRYNNTNNNNHNNDNNDNGNNHNNRKFN